MAMRSFPEEPLDRGEIISRMFKAKNDDLNFSSGRVFGSMCTEPLDIGNRVHALFLEANLGNPGLCRGTESLDREIREAVGDLIHAPESVESFSVGGATEGNIIALWRARNKSGKKKVLIPESAHFSFKKASDLLGLEPEYIPLDEKYNLDVSVLKEKLDDDTAAVVTIAGTTELGMIDPIEEIADAISDSGCDIHLHVDAAFGGFVIPFLKRLGHDLPKFDFEIDGVDTIAIDPHKMGLSTTPLGIFYSRESFTQAVESPYLTGVHQKTITGTRSSASIPAFWATMHSLGISGYVEIVERCMENTHYLIDKLGSLGLDKIVEPMMNIAAFHHEDPEQVVDKMENMGYNISRTINPPGLRVVVMPHVTKESIDELVDKTGDIL
ncbi:MAG: tyrosine decarboxylase MfnA [Thermoplasmata archaeon]